LEAYVGLSIAADPKYLLVGIITLNRSRNPFPFPFARAPSLQPEQDWHAMNNEESARHNMSSQQKQLIRFYFPPITVFISPFSKITSAE
jgi:hypothetical protein